MYGWDKTDHKELAEEVMNTWKMLGCDAVATADAMKYPINEIYALLKTGLYFESMDVRRAMRDDMIKKATLWFTQGKTVKEIAQTLHIKADVAREYISLGKASQRRVLTTEQVRQVRALMKELTVDEVAEKIGCARVDVIRCIQVNFLKWFSKRDWRAGGKKPAIGQPGVMVLRNMYRSGTGLQAVRDATGMSYQTARELIFGEEAYRNSGPVHPDILTVKPLRGFARGTKKVAPDQQKEMRALSYGGACDSEIAKAMGVSRHTVRKIVRGYRPYHQEE